MIARYHTENGSVYEIDPLGRRVRRLSGPRDPTPRQGPDGEWKTFADVRVVDGGFGDGSRVLCFVWKFEDGIARSTLTSPIVRESIPS